MEKVAATVKASSDDSPSESSLRRRRGKIATEDASQSRFSGWADKVQGLGIKWMHGKPSKSWRNFQQQRLRMSVESVQVFIRLAACVVFVGTGIRYLSSPEDYVFIFGNLFLFLLGCLTLFVLVPKASSANSVEEWFLCIAHQSAFILAGYAFTAMSVFSLDDIVRHRAFLMRYSCALGCMLHGVYLPQPWHTVFVSLPAFLLWIFFHRSVGYTPPSAFFWAIIIPILELTGFHFAELREWNLCRLMEHERLAREAGENLKEAMRGMLNVVFDASCECDAFGRLKTTSQHLQNLLGVAPDELLDLDFTTFAADPEERRRISDFLAQSAPKAAGLAVRPPTLMETSLRRQGQVPDHSSSFLRVKLCCVALPFPHVSDDDPDDCEHVQRLFVGLQEVEAPVLQRASQDTSSEHDFSDPPGKGKGGRVATTSSDHDLSDPPKKGNGGRVATTDNSSGSTERDKLSRPMPVSAVSKRGPVKVSPLTWKRLKDASIEQDSNYERRDLDARSLDSLTISLTGTHITGDARSVAPPTHATVGTQTMVIQCSSASFSSKGCQTTSGSGCPLIPGTVVRDANNSRSEGSTSRSKRSKRKAQLSKTPWLARFKGTPTVTIEFLVLEHVLVRINPFAQGCCFWHASLELLSSVLQDLASRKCSRKYEPHSGWQCMSCKGMNEGDDPDSSGDEDDAVCRICDVERASCSGNEAQSGDADVDVDSGLETESQSSSQKSRSNSAQPRVES